MRRNRKVGIGFMILWLVFWFAAILVAIWQTGAAAWNGEPAAMVFLGVWVAAALFGLWSGARRLLMIILDVRTPPPPSGNHQWDDGFDRHDR